MKSLRYALFCLVLVGFTAAFAQPQWSYDYETMTKEEYFAELDRLMKKEADAQAAIADAQAKMDNLTQQIADAEKSNEECWDAIYTMLGTDEAGYKAFIKQCKDLENAVNGFVSLSPEDIYSRRGELDDYQAQLDELRKNKISLGPEPYSILNRVESLINQGREKAKPAAAGKYEVVRGDYLWKIAGKQDIYGDPYAWIRIYSTNKSQISNPDLIYPAQVFDIPRQAGPNEHWVARGENLSDIAKSYGSAFNWQRIYEANKERIGEDPNTIYPHMVLTVPGR